MKRATHLVLFFGGLSVAAIALAQSPSRDMKDAPKGSMKDMPMASAPQGATHQGTGVVKRVDASRGAVMLDHGPIASLKWPAMSMEFGVADKKLLGDLKPGSKVRFRFNEKGKGKYVITEMKSTSE